MEQVYRKKPTRESGRQAQAFEYYWGLGNTRTLKKVAEYFGVSQRTVENWSMSFNWRRRINMRDLEIADDMSEDSIKKIADIKAKHREMVDANLIVLRKKLNYYMREMQKYDKQVEKAISAGQKIPEPPKSLQIENAGALLQTVSAFEKMIRTDLLLVGEDTERIGGDMPKTFAEFTSKYNSK